MHLSMMPAAELRSQDPTAGLSISPVNQVTMFAMFSCCILKDRAEDLVFRLLNKFLCLLLLFWSQYPVTNVTVIKSIVQGWRCTAVGRVLP